MTLILNEDSKELLKDLDTLYDYYLKHKDEHIEYGEVVIDHILIGLYLSLYEVPLPDLNKVYIGKSKIEGLGVFASKNIKKGEIVSMYPSDVVRIYHGDHYCEFKSDQCQVVDDRHAYKTNECVIFGDPTLLDNMNLVGNMINDHAQTDGSEEQNILYYHESYLKQNVKYHPYHIFVLIVACKDIMKDEELLVSYGVDYWKVIKST